MTELGLETLAERFALPEASLPRLTTLAETFATDPHAPIAGRPPRARVLEEHLADSLVGLELAVVRNGTEIVDIGSGAGLPGLPLALAIPSARVAALESNARKAAFIADLVGRCELDRVRAVAERAESWPEGIGQFDLALARALAPLGVVAEYAAPLLRCGGALVAWRGRRDSSDERAAEDAATQLGLELDEVRQVFPFRGAAHRHLHVLRKVRPTPERFPRRPGVARKRALGTSV